MKFSTQPDLSHQKCYELLTKSWSKFSEVSKVRQKLFIKYVCCLNVILSRHFMVLLINNPFSNTSASVKLY